MTAEEAPSTRFKPEAGVVIAGKVRLERLLARGGMGSVWVGKHLGLDIPVAVKFMTQTTDQSLGRFRREARVAAKIKSANIVTILDYGVDQDTPYIVMELLEGESLGARLKRVGYVSLLEAERILVPIAKALERAHEAHLVHRDLKPDNIFIAREGNEEVPKILDFGIVKSLSSTSRSSREETEDGAVIGTLHYMSPEQARGLPDIDHRADIWSLGVILYRMLTGRRPFRATGFAQVIMQICSEPHVPATSILPALPAEIDEFFNRALAKTPAQRFSSIKEMAQAYTALVKKFGPRTETSSVFPALTTIDSSDDPTLVKHPQPAQPTQPVQPALPTVSITVDPVSEAETISRAPSRSGAFVGIALAVVITGALSLVGVLMATSSTPENATPGESSVTPAASLPAVAESNSAEVATAAMSASAATSATAKPETGPASKTTVKKPVDSTSKKKKRDFGY